MTPTWRAFRAGRLACALVWLAAPVQAERVSGVVFLDANGNGTLDAGEKGLPRVPVTDSVSFVTTDESGRYAIDAQLDGLLPRGVKAILTVSFPSGTWPTAGWMRRLDEAKDLAQVHFGLRRIEPRLPFTFVHGTDSHVPRGGAGLFPQFRAEVEGLRDSVTFCILTGDLVNLADSYPIDRALADYEFFAKHTHGFPVPLFCTSGNHEATGTRSGGKADPSHPLYGYGMYWKFVGPLRWSFNYAGYHLAGVDYNWLRGGQWTWGVPPSAIAWLQRDLELAPKEAPVLFFVHFPSGAPGLDAVLQQFPVKHIFCGHSHAEVAFAHAGIPSFQSGSLSQIGGDRKPGYRLVHVTENGVETFYKALGEPHAIALDVPRDGHVLQRKATVRGAFYDAAREITQLTITVGKDGAAGTRVPFRRTPICCRFEAGLDLSGVPAGFRRLEVAVSTDEGQATWREARNYLMLSGHQGEFAATGDAALELDVAGIDAGAQVALNGEPLQALAPTRRRGDGPFRAPVRDADTVTVAVPGARLRRLNTIELRPVAKADGQPDAFCTLDVRLRYGGKTFRDFRLRRGPYHPRPVRGPAACYIDLLPD